MSDSFDAEWRRLSLEGACDEIGGMEYERVRREWFAAGRPLKIATFIKARANQEPPR